MATHVGPWCPNITEGWEIRLGEDELFYVWIAEKVYCECGCPNCTSFRTEHRLHTGHVSGSLSGFAEEDEAIEWIEGLQEAYDEDFDRYQEEHHYEIAQQERWEAQMNER